jgi:hypothetical protein
MQKQRYYHRALEAARKEIQSLDPADMANRCGAEYRVTGGNEELLLEFFGHSYTITFPEIRFSSSGGHPISLVTRIILLHYVIHANGSDQTNDLIPYKEIPGGMAYAGVFHRRVVDPLIRAFGSSPGGFCAAGVAMGGEKAAFGDTSFLLRVLPRVTITFIMWRGDEEFPPSIQILFDRSIEGYLSLEDVVVLGEMASKRLIARSPEK